MPDLETSLTYCTYCPKLCRHTCPVSHAEAKETLTPQTKMANLRRLHLQTVTGAEAKAHTDPLYGCTGCGACTEACLHGVEVGPSLFIGRAEAERDGRGHEALRDLPARFVAHARAAADEIRESIPQRRRPAEAQVAFLPGCGAPGLATTMLALCDRLGADYVAVADTTLACGGYPLLAAGQHDEFRLHAERFVKELRGYARVVMHCPSCAHTMKRDYARFGVPVPFQVEHTVEFLESFTERLPIQQKRGRVFYHDPCYLGRHQGLYDPPRRLANKAVDELVEFSRNRGESECSGGGGLLPITMPSTASAIADHRLTEVKEAHADTVVTSCSSCKKQLTRDGVTAVDLIELLNAATTPATTAATTPATTPR